VGLTEGSLIAIFRDAAEFAGGVNDLIELGKTVANVLGGALGGMGAAALFRRKKKKVGVRTVESLAKIAAASESHVQLRYKGVEGDRLFVEVTPSQARQMQKLIAEAKDLAATSSTETDKRAVAELGDAFTRLVERVANGEQSDSDLEVLLKVLVEVARKNRVTHLLTSLAQDLESRGQLATALRLRQMVDSSVSTGGTEPPLLT
jgi:hypothetical protein